MSLVDLGKRLLDAAKRGETEEVRTLMSNGAPFTTDWLGTSPLHFAAQYGHNYTAEVLLRAGISRDARTKVDRTPLHVASQEGHVEIVELLLQHAADIDAKDMLKMTPLHWSTEKGHMLVIETLLKHGADVNCENKFDRTPLDIAIINGRQDIVQLLQLAQVHHTSVGNLTEEPSETVTVETSEVPGEDTIITTEGETITIEGTEYTQKADGTVLPMALVPNLSSESVVRETGEGSSTSVLATLAALAEATAPNNATNVSTNDAMNWLESQGITMITTADGNIITSAVESGQTITLTEAGKIALNIIKQQGLAQNPDEETDITEETILKTEPTDPDDDAQKVITIVTEPGTEMVEEVNGTVLTVPLTDEPTEEGVLHTTADIDEPPVKKMAIEEAGELDIENLLQPKEDTGGEGDGPDVPVTETAVDQECLKKELEEIKRQAEAFKEQLKQKDKDLEQYKQKLSQMAEKSPSKS